MCPPQLRGRKINGAFATWWLLSVGGEAEAQADTPLDIKIPSVPGAVRRRRRRIAEKFSGES
ncbi:MAG: hypothetical protein NTX45_05395 [Proteobacteria bacterium]|nr:hypothetical protein [Pseudomonadota bacterium]